MDFYTKNYALSTDVNLLGLDETSSVAYNSGEIQTCIFYFLLFGPRYRLRRNPRKRKKGSFEVLKHCYKQICPTSFLLCYLKAANFQLM